jgi:peptidyl-prolyl cis-trans isomerase B (cyclophilin B)
VASNKRERELARMRAERQAARRAAAEAQRRRRRNSILAGVAALAVIALIVGLAVSLGGGKKTDTLAAPAATASAATAAKVAPGTCTYKPSGTSAKKLTGTPAATGVQTTGTRHAVLKTSQGTVEADLLAGKAPCTVNSFAFLASQRYFDNTSCHRLTTTGIYVLQCGDPTGTGTGGPGYQFADENLTGATYPKGTLAMANSGPGTNGSQFFLVYQDTQLPASYTPFGTITKGLDVILKVAKAGVDSPGGDGKPKLPVRLETVTVR